MSLSFRHRRTKALAAGLGAAALAVWLLTPSPVSMRQACTPSGFSPVADTYVNSSSPKANHSKSTVLRAGKNPTRVSYLRFNVSGLSGSVSSATLKLYVTRNGGDVSLHRVSNNNWSTNGARVPSYDAGVSSVGSTRRGKWISLDAKSIVSGNGTFSMALTSNSSATLASTRASSRSWPSLIINAGTSSFNNLA